MFCPAPTYQNCPSGSRSSPRRSIRSGGSFDVDGKLASLERLERELTDPEVWGDPERAKSLQQERARLTASVESARRLESLLEDAETLLELAREGEEVGGELRDSVLKLESSAEAVEMATLLSGEHDGSSAILEIHPGAGGTESQDWAEMLLRMYTRWSESHGFKVETLDWQAGDEAGIKSATLGIHGANAYGYLRVERGVHRLVRISPFDAQSRRHTSFASVEVVPEIEDDIEIVIDDKDIRIDTYRASGAGGQHVNKTDSAVRITHLSSGLVVSCQNERSQHRNKDVAMSVLRSKLYDLERLQADEKMAGLVGEKKKIEWGNQIRSYVLAPYRMVKDHRTNHEVGNADRVLDGDLDGFIRGALVKLSDPGQGQSARGGASGS